MMSVYDGVVYDDDASSCWLCPFMMAIMQIDANVIIMAADAEMVIM